jgi:hypothetical protein
MLGREAGIVAYWKEKTAKIRNWLVKSLYKVWIVG